MNLASGEVNVELIANRIGGPLDAVGGHWRPDTVLDATTHDPLPRESLQKGGSDAPPWQIIGGSHGLDRGQARPPTRPERTRETTGIERFQLGIVALGGRRFSSDGGTSSDNEVELDLLHLRLGTEGREAADFLFAGVLTTLGQFSASDENTVRVRIRKTTRKRPPREPLRPQRGLRYREPAYLCRYSCRVHPQQRKIDPAPPAEFLPVKSPYDRSQAGRAADRWSAADTHRGVHVPA